MSSAESSVSSDSDSSDEEHATLAAGPAPDPATAVGSAPAKALAPVPVAAASRQSGSASGGDGAPAAPGVGGAVRMEPKGRPQGLVFDSSFESGNLAQVTAVDGSPNEYELFIRPDTHNDKYRLWFYFSVRPTPCLTQRRVLFHIVNFSKSKSNTMHPDNVWSFQNTIIVHHMKTFTEGL